ncbi:MAG: hypothetical protein F6K24_24030 [Okeania sp. SIO2D1]|nr:hypothetical protein [Okeania sp. SIO2D1]
MPLRKSCISYDDFVIQAIAIIFQAPFGALRQQSPKLVEAIYSVFA